jgi:hypothetical protein
VLALLAGLGASVTLTPAARSDAQMQHRLQALLAHARSVALTEGRAVEVRAEANQVISSAGVPALKLPEATSLRWRPALGGPGRPEGIAEVIVFYPDGSATPGILDVVVHGQGGAVRVEWWGGIDAARAR